MGTLTIRPTTPDVDDELLTSLIQKKRTLSDEQVRDMLDVMRPVVRKDDQLFYTELVEPYSTSFIKDPTLAHEALGVKEVHRIYTLHTYKNNGRLFTPIIEEVLAMIPEDSLESVKAFETFGPFDRNDQNRQAAATRAGYFVAVTILYG